MQLEFEFDPNFRTDGNHTVVTPDEWTGEGVMPSLRLLDELTLVEPESGIRGRGFVADIDEKRGLIFVDVDWSSLFHPDDQGAEVTSPLRFTGGTFSQLTDVHPLPAAFTNALGDLRYGVGAGVLHPILVEEFRQDLNSMWAAPAMPQLGGYRTVATTR